jgi:hypothetical protein
LRIPSWLDESRFHSVRRWSRRTSKKNVRHASLSYWRAHSGTNAESKNTGGARRPTR